MPEFYLFGGPNGAGKTTTAIDLLPSLGCDEFINADLIARGLAPFKPDSVAWRAGVLMMKKLRELAETGVDFGTETTLSARAYVPFIESCRARGYGFNLFYIWLPDAEMAVERVAARVRSGGHDIPPDVIRRRYHAGRRNFNELYRPLADRWAVFDNSQRPYQVVAHGGREQECEILLPEVWRAIEHEN